MTTQKSLSRPSGHGATDKPTADRKKREREKERKREKEKERERERKKQTPPERPQRRTRGHGTTEQNPTAGLRESSLAVPTNKKTNKQMYKETNKQTNRQRLCKPHVLPANITMRNYTSKEQYMQIYTYETIHIYIYMSLLTHDINMHDLYLVDLRNY